MITSRVSDANDNLQTTFTSLANCSDTGAVADFETIAAVAVGVPVPLFNRVFVFGVPKPGEFDRGVDWLLDRCVPFFVTIPDHIVDDVEAVTSDLDAAWSLTDVNATQPGMLLASLEGIPAAVSDADSDLVVEEVTDSAGLEEFVEVSSEAFGAPRDVGRRLAHPALLAEDRMRLLVGRFVGRPVASGLISRTGDVAGVYTIGVLPAYRERGFDSIVEYRQFTVDRAT